MAAEVEKLRTENSNLRAPIWKTPAFLISLAGLALSLVGNVIQFQSTRSASATAERQVALAESRWREEREKLRVEIEELRQKARLSADQRAAIEAELSRVNRDIAVWDNALFQDSLRMKALAADLASYESSNRPAMAEAARKKIALQKDMMRLKTEEKNAAVQRRSELERRLGC